MTIRSAIVDVYVYNTEFSINPPGQPIVPATIVQGDTIRWVWVQGGHTTTAVMGSTEQWNEPINSSSTVYMRQFNTPGVYWYYCIPHGDDDGDGTASGMASTVTVLTAGSGACCLPDGSCITTDEGDCLLQDGIFSGVGSLCDTTVCTVTSELIADKDNILYQSIDGSLSNGSGSYLYTGNNNDGIRRAVVAFDLSEIPTQSVVIAAELQLYCNSSSGNAYPVDVHRLTSDWGEGTSDANGNEGSGSASTAGDATWLHTFYDTAFWQQPGGDFADSSSASTLVDAAGQLYTWASSALTSDVMMWLDTPSVNYGWMLRGDENTTDNTKRFSSIQSGDSAEFPRLILQLSVPPTGACCMPDGSCNELSEAQCNVMGGTFQGLGTECISADCAIQLTPFLDSLPIPGVAIPVSGMSGSSAHYRMVMEEHYQQLHSELPTTRVWGFNGSYPGPTIEARRDTLVTVQWVNDLRVYETGVLRTQHPLFVDTCLHGPNVTGQVPVTVTHLHGGKVPPGSDGYPEDVFPPGDSADLYYYPNIQPSGTLWYHDHALGITRLNVMMGLAGFYLIRDANEDTLNLPSGEFEIPLAIQDRSFNPDGSIRYLESFEDQFFGDVILVNGKVWPYLNVKRGKYRFRLLNGSNSRAYTLSLSNGDPITQIGAELGLFDTAAVLDSITLLPGERADVIVDFSSESPGNEIILTNSAPAPFPGFPGVGVIPDVMKFIVEDAPGDQNPLPSSLAVVENLDTGAVDEERIFELFTMSAPLCDGPNQPVWTINGLLWDTITELPILNSTEIWTWHNESGISHPMHMHMVTFQVVDRQAIDDATGLPTGPLIPPKPYEKGWKDTAHSPPGYRTRVITRFEGFTGKYPYHCHILEHEDHEMMRQFEVLPCTNVSKTVDHRAGSLRFASECATPGDTIVFSETLAGDTLILDDSLTLSKDLTFLNPNSDRIYIDGPGIDHLFTITPGAEVTFKNLNLISGQGSSGRALINKGTLNLEDVIIIDRTGSPGADTLILNQGSIFIKGKVEIIPANN